MGFPATMSNILHTEVSDFFGGGGEETPSPVPFLIQILYLTNNVVFRNSSHLKGWSIRKQNYVIILFIEL